MNQEEIPADVKALISAYIDSVLQLEALLLLQANPGRQYSATEIARELRIDPSWAESQLDKLCVGGLLVCGPTTKKTYQYTPRTPELHQATQALAQCYTDRRVTVISLIFSKPVDKIRTFADAFKLRKDKNDG